MRRSSCQIGRISAGEGKRTFRRHRYTYSGHATSVDGSRGDVRVCIRLFLPNKHGYTLAGGFLSRPCQMGGVGLGAPFETAATNAYA